MIPPRHTDRMTSTCDTHSRSQLFEQHAYEPHPSTLYTSHIVHTFLEKDSRFWNTNTKQAGLAILTRYIIFLLSARHPSRHNQELMIQGEGVL